MLFFCSLLVLCVNWFLDLIPTFWFFFFLNKSYGIMVCNLMLGIAGFGILTFSEFLHLCLLVHSLLFLCVFLWLWCQGNTS